MGEPNTNIFIAGLPAEVDEATLKEVFGAYGTVTWGKVFDGKGKPDKVGIIEFSDIAEAQWVVENLDGNIPQGLSAAVKITFKHDNRSKGKGDGKKGGGGKGWGGGGDAKGAKGWSAGGGNFGKSFGGGKSFGKSFGGGKAPQIVPPAMAGGGGGFAAPNTNIFIADLPMEVDEAMLNEVFGAYGTVTWSKLMDGKGKPSKAAIVEFGDIAEAKWCVENLDGNIPQGLSGPVKITYKQQKSKGDWGKGDQSFGKGKSKGKSWGKY
jgi:RNA recognition motif-containing protein